MKYVISGRRGYTPPGQSFVHEPISYLLSPAGPRRRQSTLFTYYLGIFLIIAHDHAHHAKPVSYMSRFA